MCSKEGKAGKTKEVLFKLYSTGISTNRDEWIVDLSEKNLTNKMKFFSEYFNALDQDDEIDFSSVIKWSRNLKQRFMNGLKERFNKKIIIRFNYRPFLPYYLYHSKLFIDEQGLTNSIFKKENLTYCISGIGSAKDFQILSVNSYPSLDLLEKTQCLPIYRYTETGERKENITDWGLEQFINNYDDKNITKEDIFNYVYGVLHNPAYREKYKLNLKREFPRIPFYEVFRQWAEWGKALMDLHINYETAEPFPLKREDEEAEKKSNGLQPKIKVKLKADKDYGKIILDEETVLCGIPREAWKYKLGNRSALEWILDQYKEKKPKDPTIAEKFNTYRFADYKEEVIELLKKVCTVSVETMKIINEMAKEKQA